jgi:hypothetical protein
MFPKRGSPKGEGEIKDTTKRITAFVLVLVKERHHEMPKMPDGEPGDKEVL